MTPRLNLLFIMHGDKILVRIALHFFFSNNLKTNLPLPNRIDDNNFKDYKIRK